MRLAKAGYAPIKFWLDMPLGEMQEWIKVHNKLIYELEQKQ